FVVSVFATLTCLAATTVTTHTVNYTFNTQAGLNALGITVPESGRYNELSVMGYVQDDVTMTPTNGTQKNRIYNHSTYGLELYLYNGGSLTFSVPNNCNLTQIKFQVNNLRYLTNVTDSAWNGSAQSVSFAASGGTVYVFNITVTYTKTVTTPDLTTVTGISNFKNVTPGTAVRLYLPDDYNARVLAVKHNANGTTDAYVRDNTGAMLMQGISPNRTMAYNQHLAGWIDGQYATNANGLPCFVPANGLTNTTQLVIADPVTEATVEPRSITANQYNNYLADWVSISDVRVGGSNNLTLSNALSNYQAPYSGALIDASGIVAGNRVLYLVSQGDVPAITYVIDASQQIVSPPQNLAGVRVRLNRVFTEGTWIPFTLPFTTSDFTGDIMEYYGLAAGATAAESGNTYDMGRMMFLPVGEMEAGLPYLVRASVDIDGMIYDNVTLMSMTPSTVTHTLSDHSRLGESDAYSFVGTFTPVTIAVNIANKVLVEGGVIEWVTNSNNLIPGTSAYFVTPDNQGLELELVGMNDDIVTSVNNIVVNPVQRPKGIYNMMGVKMQLDWEQLPPGIYIVNGHKTIKR
ncbi:MAG: hypothetical protein II087_00285, partial [Muribaculaceae bacterium]|nr:hypothetical protein [Muribaculaceae bacterium]